MAASLSTCRSVSDYNDEDSGLLSDIEGSTEEYSQTEENDQHINNEQRQKNSTRRKVRNPANWKGSILKRKRNCGEEYVGTGGKLVPKKIFVNRDCNCRKKCFEKISSSARERVFKAFWKMGDLDRQNAYICGLIERNAVSRRRASMNIRKSKSCTYTYNIQLNNSLLNVCKNYFQETFDISRGRLMRTLESYKDESLPLGDKRKKRYPPHQLDKDLVEAVNEHIKMYPANKSHYTREKNPNRKYLHPDLTIAKMYRMYIEKCEELQKPSVKESYYRHVFNTQHNLHFHAPRTDTCKTCDEYQIKMQASDNDEIKNQLKSNHELHLRKAENARKSLREDTALAKEGKIYGLTMDLHKALSFPKLSVSVAYYKRNMYVYNFGIHELATDEVFFYVWDETIAGRGSEEIASCLVKHLEDHTADKKKIVIYSDCCGGQNRNINLTSMLMKYITRPNITSEIIDHKFLVPGHTYLPNDRDFGVVEAANKKREHIYTPDQWYEIMRTARKKKPFHVIQMTSKDFLSSAALKKTITNRKITVDKKKVAWLKMSWMQYSKDEHKSMKFKTALQEFLPFDKVCFEKRTNGRPKMLCNVQQGMLYRNKRPVTQSKKSDMLDLLPYIPLIHHDYYSSLIVTK